MDSRTVSMYSPLGALGGMLKAIGVGLLDSMGFLLSRMHDDDANWVISQVTC